MNGAGANIKKAADGPVRNRWQCHNRGTNHTPGMSAKPAFSLFQKFPTPKIVCRGKSMINSCATQPER
jgi:hypothetical protein